MNCHVLTSMVNRLKSINVFITSHLTMATKNEYEYDKRYGWYRNELASLGLIIKKRNEFNNIKELSGLAENIKRAFIYNYKNSS